MSQAEEPRKRLQEASPEKQRGVRSHDKKRRNMTSRTPSDMEESEEEAQSPSPLTIPPPNFSQLSISQTTTQNGEEDTTMVGSSPEQSPIVEGRERRDPPPHMPATPVTHVDPPWIVGRRRLTTPNPTQTQVPQGPPPRLPQQPQLPKDLTRTPTPVGGFPVIHLSTPPWYNLLPEQKGIFETYPDPKLWIRDWQASKEADLMATSDNLKELIRRMTGEKAKLSTPQQEKELGTKRRNERQKPPYHFLISGISERANEILLANPIISTPDASAYILPYNPPLPRFFFTMEGLTLSIKSQEAIEESEDAATQIVRKTLSENEALITLLKGKLMDDGTSQHNMDPAMDIVRSLEVKLVKGEELVDRTAKFGTKKPLWNIFFKTPPPIAWTSYFIILQHIRDTKFIDMDCGSATLVDEENRLHCYNCKGADHNPPQCDYIKLEGWFGNKAQETSIEETAEFAPSSRNEKPNGGDRRRNEHRGGGWNNGGQNQNYNNPRRDRR